MLISPTFFVSWSQRKWGKEISGSLRLAATTMPSRPSTEPLLPAAILAAEIGSLRRPDASRRPCVRLLPTRSSLRAFRAPLKGSKVSVHSSLPLSVPRRGNLLLSFQRDKRSKTASAFFVLGTQRNPNQRKVIHLIILACAVRCHHSAQGFASDLRTQPRLFRRFGATIRLGFRLLPFTIQHPASAGNSKIFAMRRFWSRNLRLDRLGVNHRYLSVRCHALRRSLALAADKTPFLPQMGDSFFREERSKEQFDRLPSRTPQHGVRDLGCAFIAST